jgi:hypothetical protein
MNGMKKSSRSTPEPVPAFTRVALRDLVPPQGLFDRRVPVKGGLQAHLLPLIVCRNRNMLTVIDGCKRLALLKKAGKRSAVCGIIKKVLRPKEAGLLRIRLNAGRQLHPREKLLFTGWLKSNCTKNEYCKQSEKLRLTSAERHEYEQLAACRPWLIEAVMQGRLDPTVAPEMNHLSESDAGSIVLLFSRLSFSRSMQRELAEWLPEIAYIKKIPLAGLLISGPFSEILDDTRLNDPQKVARFHDLAHTLRFPLYSETKKRWTEITRAVNPEPSMVTFHQSPFFETNTLEIRIKAEKAEEMERTIKRLASIDLNKWQELIDPTAKTVTPSADIDPDRDL